MLSIHKQLVRLLPRSARRATPPTTTTLSISPSLNHHHHYHHHHKQSLGLATLRKGPKATTSGDTKGPSVSGVRNIAQLHQPRSTSGSVAEGGKLPFTAYPLTPQAPPPPPPTSIQPHPQLQPQPQLQSQLQPSVTPTTAAAAATAAAAQQGQPSVEQKRRMDNSFYMRELPASADLIPYDSAEGKGIFKAALEEGGLEAFFPLSQQFLTQEEPAYCGIGTLCMILNALKVDPAKTWRRPWRWFTQEMLDCCRPLDYVRTNGITLNEFTCLARCNGLEANTKYADKISLEDFRKDIIASTTTSSQIMAVSYSRSALGQTGSGHFSPVGGYSSQDGGKVLILDVARFKYPSYWVSLRALYESLIPVDPMTKQPRGYSLLKKPPKEVAESTHLLRLGFTKATWPAFFKGAREVVERLEMEAEVAGEALSLKALTEGLGLYVARKQADGFMPIRTRREVVRNGGGITSTTTATTTTTTTTAAAGTTPQTISKPSSIAFDSQKALPSALEYTDALKTFLTHLSTTSQLYHLLPSASTPKETQITTILLLAMYSFSPFLKLLKPALKEEVEAFVQRDLQDSEVRREVAGVRRQMSSLETCCREECGDECALGGCAGKAA